jgi:cytochrome c biogenesis protein
MWALVDRLWLALGSVKITLLLFITLLLLSIPGTIVLQENISNVDPALKYDYEFWRFGQWIQLFRSYHSFWYVGLLALLSMNLIICSYERWPQMWRFAFAKPVVLHPKTLENKAPEQIYTWEMSQKATQNFKENFETWAQKKWLKYKLLEDEKESTQFFWQKNRLARLANYVVHTSLLMIFGGAIWSGIYGFEGVLNIPEGQAVDTFLMFKEGASSGLERPPGDQGLKNERMMDFRLEAAHFHVAFYEDFPGRPKEFATRLNAIDRGTGEIVASQTIRVNEPLAHGKYTFYQASYGELGDYKLKFRVVRKSSLKQRGGSSYFEDQKYFESKLGQVHDLGSFKLANTQGSFVVLNFVADLQGHGPAVQAQELKGDDLVGEPFWVLKDNPTYDFGRESDWALVLDEYKPLYFTGLQVGYDPGAPIYWFGCLGMLLGTFYALFFQHKKFYVIRRGRKLILTGSTHRLPFSFEEELKKIAADFQSQVIEGEVQDA